MTSESPVEEAPRPIGVIDHWCEHPGCKAWGCFGFTTGRETRWFCDEHKAAGHG